MLAQEIRTVGVGKPNRPRTNTAVLGSEVSFSFSIAPVSLLERQGRLERATEGTTAPQSRRLLSSTGSIPVALTPAPTSCYAPLSHCRPTLVGVGPASGLPSNKSS